MKIIDFYKKGARVVIERSAGINPLTLAAGTGGEEDIAYVPSGGAKVVEGPAHDTIVHAGTTYLLLRGGYVYEVLLDINGSEKSDKISAEHGHLILPIPAGASVVAAENVE